MIDVTISFDQAGGVGGDTTWESVTAEQYNELMTAAVGILGPTKTGAFQ